MKMTQVRAAVTGGASGLGHAVASHLIALGGRATMLDVQEAAGTQAARALGERAHYERCDVTDESSVIAAMSAAAKAMGGLNVLINCAGIGGSARTLGKAGPMPAELYGKVIQVNLVGTFLCDKAAAALMQHNAPNEEGERGLIVHTSSVAAYEGQIGQAAYSATKAGVIGMTLPLAREFAALGIRVMSIAPGIFHTPMLAALPPEVQESLGKQVPFPARLGRPEEFARLVQAICEITMLNGSTIRLDGAIRMQPR